ncbi:Nonribosomal peptide synthetase 14 [Dichotomopilus funicola]|uniref:Nonribosomal peptide synthetase 14 n=1 Tax=Dichotomopilus funicola TaxID=1934379 RepID=A0AAN6ZJU6_9PEZI|nr:Nonribosomal peptide synthetase 14 [Dichotomopilus funicola]
MSYKMPVSEPIAIVGSSCRFAGGVTSPSRLWELLKEPVDLTQDVPAERFNIKAFYHANGEYHGTTNSPKAYFLDQDHRVFDASFFNISPKEAEAIDPQQRMLLEVVYEALESAGYTLQQYAGDKVAVYAGLMTSDYDTLSQRDELDTSQYYATGNARSILSNRISYFFNFRGPSMTIDTACSSSLVALHQAVLSLRAGECKMACVAGANLILTPEQFIVESNLHMLSPTGHCRMWDAGADGYARGEGVAAMFIKPLSQAIADGDHIEAVIRETGVNSDGRSRGITMPNWKAQSQLLRDTYQRAGLDIDKPEDRCQYFEAHGTGTSAGDPNEARAIEDAFFGRNKDVKDQHKLLVGSVKTVIGHTEGAAGLAGLLKMVQSMKHNAVTPNLHLDTLNPAVAPFCTHLAVPTALTAWPAVAAGQPKRGSVNSFGFGGTNAHVIVEEYVPELHNPAGAERGQKHVELIGLMPGVNGALVDHGSWPTEAMALCLPLVLSAPSPKALVAVAQSYLDYLVKNPSTNISELAWHTYKRRTAFPFRMAVSVMSVSGLTTKLKGELSKAGASSNNLTNQNGVGANISTRVRQGDTPPKILGIFTGQGAQWPTMARALFVSCPAFASVIHSLDGILQHCPDPPEWLLAGQILADPADSQLDKASVAQPVCTAIQLALVKVLTEILGIRFRAVVGHSSGEIAAAFAAGRIGIAEAMLIAHYRGMGVHLAQGDPDNNDGQAKGGMLAAGLTWQEAKHFCSQSRFKGRLWVAASNAPGSVTLSGHRNAVSQAMRVLTTRGKFARALRVDTAYHSPLMDAAADAYVEVLRKCEITPTDGNSTTVWVSSVEKNQPPSDEDLAAVYWRDNMVQPVMFAEAVGAAVDSLGPFDCAVEVGPHPALMGPVSQVLAAKNVAGMPYLGIFDRKLDDREAFAGFLGKMWTLFGSSAQQIEEFVKAHGVEGLHNKNSSVVDFPTYPWDHTQAFYRESRLSRQYHFKSDAPHELLGVRTRDDDGKHQLRWRNLLKADRLPWVQHHKFQGQALLPASAYLVMALDAAKALLGKRAASTVELCDLKFPAGIILEGNVPMEVLFTLTVEEEDADTIKASMLLTSARADSSDTSGKAMTAAMKKNFTGSMIITLGPPTPDALPFPTLVATRPETRPADPAAFYDMMRKDTGLEYTGPFRALQSLDRRHEFATATVRRHDEELDTTTLKLSPAMLDGCLQTAFVTVSAPGDGEIWTAFLPVSMEKVVFNLGVGDNADTSTSGEPQDQEDSIWDDDGMLVVDAYLTKATPATKHTPASFTADIEIFQPSIGYLEIQVIGLTVGSFGASTTSDNVWELYLTTRFDVDPDDEIVLPGPECTNPATMGLLIDSCERVAGFYTEYGLSSWPKETQADIDAFIASSPYFVTLETIRAFGLYMPLLITDAVTLLTRDGQELLGLQRHVARVVRQIAHKYPAMNVLGVTDPTLGLTSHVMEGLGGSFASFCLGGEVEKYLENRTVWWETDKERVKVSRVILEVAEDEEDKKGDKNGNKKVDKKKDEKKEYKGVVYDLVVLTTADITNPVMVLESVKRMMRPGGFLLLVHETKMKAQPFHNWPVLLDHYGFGFVMKNSHQGLASLRKYGITVRQAEARDKHTLLLPLGINTKKKPQPLTDRLVIVGGTSMPTAILAAGVCERLNVLSRQPVRIVDTLDDISLDTSSGSDASTGRRAKPKASAITAAIFLQDLEEPIVSQATDDRLAVLRALFRPDMVILWVVRNARYNNPEHAASLGFARTILAEIPGLTLKMVDLQVQGGISVEGSATVVAEMFARLLKQNTVGETELWSNEPEVHVDRGKLLVPRVMPWEEANKRVNAPRKESLTFWNSVEHLIRVVPNRDDAAPEKFGLEVDLDDVAFSPSADPNLVHIHVQFSTVDAIDIAGRSYYICFGRDVETCDSHAALSTVNASHIFVPRSQLHTVEDNLLNVGRVRPVGDDSGVPIVEDQLLFLDCLVRQMSTMALLREAREFTQCGAVLLVEPDALFRECLTAAFNTVGVGIRSCSTDPMKCAAVAEGVDMECVHPRASATVVKGLFRSPNTLIIDMSDGRSVLSDMLKRHAPRGSRYMTHGSLMNSHLGKDDREENRVKAVVENHEDNRQGNQQVNGHQNQKVNGEANGVNTDSNPDEEYDELARFWSFSNSLAVITIRGIAAPTGHRTIVTVPDLVKRTTPLPPFSFIHWAKERIVDLPTRSSPLPANGPPLLNPKKTYLLVGLTRDLGQSLVTLFVKLGARIFVLCSRNPPSTMPAWGQQLRSKGIYIHFACLNVISLHDVHNLRVHLTQTMKLPPIGGVVNGAMVLEDCVFSHLTAETLKRVLLPKTVGSVNLNRVFCEPDMDFFIMTSSFAAIGGHAGQSNYAAANMFMNGLAAGRRKRGLCATAINIGVIYGLGFLNREKEELYQGLEREGYPAISERDLHHMFVEAIVAGRPSNTDQGEQGIYDIVTGLRRFEAGRPTLHWHRDPRFGHFVTYNTSDDTTNPTSGTEIPIKKRIADPSHTQASLTTLLTEAFVTQLTTQLHLDSSSGAVTPEHSLAELGADSLAAVDLRNWAWRVLGLDVAVMKVLGAATVKGLCEELAEGVLKKCEQSQSQGE